MTIDRALSGNPFSIDQFRCRDAAASLARFRPAHVVEPWGGLPHRQQLVFKALFISICHQFNWDYLQAAMAGWLLPNPIERLPVIERVRHSEIAALLADYPKQERVRARQRARMLRETAGALSELVHEGELDRLIAEARLDGLGGFYEVMKRVPAFAEDGLEKKVRVLAHDVFREGIIGFQDPENLRPAVEYHLLRLYLRTGRVYPTDDAIRDALRAADLTSRGRLVTLLRKAVEEAMNLTSFYSDVDVATLNYVEWQIARSLCTPDVPAFCDDQPIDDLPPEIAALCDGGCAFRAFCRSHTEPNYGWFHEPQFQKAIY